LTEDITRSHAPADRLTCLEDKLISATSLPFRASSG